MHFLILTLDSSSIAATYTHTTSTTEAPCVPTVATNPDPVGCRCINFVTGAGDGNCLTASPDPSHCDLRFCYVACTIFSCPSTCQDLIESTVIPGLFYSSQACLWSSSSFTSQYQQSFPNWIVLWFWRCHLNGMTFMHHSMFKFILHTKG